MKLNKLGRNRIANVLGVLSIIGLVNYWTAILSSVYDRFGWDASMNIGLDSLVFAFAIALTGLILKRKNKICWVGLVISVLLFFALLLFTFPFAQLEWTRP